MACIISPAMLWAEKPKWSLERERCAVYSDRPTSMCKDCTAWIHPRLQQHLHLRTMVLGMPLPSLEVGLGFRIYDLGFSMIVLE